MQSRLWEGGESSNGFVSSGHSWHQGRWENGKKTKNEAARNSLGHTAEAAAAGGAGAGAGAAITASSTVGKTIRTSDMATNLALSPRENPFAHAIPTTTSSSSLSSLSRARRSRPPRSDSAVHDGRKFLAAFRAQRRSNPPASVAAATATHPSSSSSSSSAKTRLTATESPQDATPGLADALVQRLDRYQSCEPGLSRNLEAALEASSARGQHQPGEGSSNSKSDRMREKGVGGDNGGQDVVGESSPSSSSRAVVVVDPQDHSAHDSDNRSSTTSNNSGKPRTSSSPLAGAAGGGANGNGGGGGSGEEEADSFQPTDGATAAAAAGEATSATIVIDGVSAAKPSPTTDSERSPERPSPEVRVRVVQH